MLSLDLYRLKVIIHLDWIRGIAFEIIMETSKVCATFVLCFHMNFASRAVSPPPRPHCPSTEPDAQNEFNLVSISSSHFLQRSQKLARCETGEFQPCRLHRVLLMTREEHRRV